VHNVCSLFEQIDRAAIHNQNMKHTRSASDFVWEPIAISIDSYTNDLPVHGEKVDNARTVRQVNWIDMLLFIL
jgi:hypothetical protein